VNVIWVEDGSVIGSINISKDQLLIIDPDAENKTLDPENLTKDGWIIRNLEEDQEFFNQIKGELYNRISQYIPELKETYGITDEELDALLEGYILGIIDLPPETPDWVRDIIELS
jgi:hypothetical protein